MTGFADFTIHLSQHSCERWIVKSALHLYLLGNSYHFVFGEGFAFAKHEVIAISTKICFSLITEKI